MLKVNYGTSKTYPPNPISFYEEYKNEINWWTVSNNIISETFANKFSDYLRWDEISCKKLSEDFIKKFPNKIKFEILFTRHKYDELFCFQFLKYVNKEYLVDVILFQEFSKETVDDLIYLIPEKTNRYGPMYREKYSELERMYGGIK